MLVPISSHRDGIAQLALGVGTIPERGRAVVDLILIVNRQSAKTQSRRDVGFGCGGEDTDPSSRSFAGEGFKERRNAERPSPQPSPARAGEGATPLVILANARIQTPRELCR